MNRFFFFRKFQRLTSFSFQDPFFLHQSRLKKKSQGIQNPGNFRLWFFGFKLYLRNRYNTLSHSVLKKYKLFQGNRSRIKQKRKIKVKLTTTIKRKIRRHIKRAFKHKYKLIFIPKPSKFSFRKTKKDLLHKVLRSRSRLFRRTRNRFPLMSTLRIRKLKLLRKLAIRPQAKILSVRRKLSRKMKMRGILKSSKFFLRGLKWITKFSNIWKDNWTDVGFPLYEKCPESRPYIHQIWDNIRPFKDPKMLRLAEKRKQARYKKTLRILNNWRTSSSRRFKIRFKTASYRYKKFSTSKTLRFPRKRIKKKVFIRRLFTRIINNFNKNKIKTKRKLPNIFWKNYRSKLDLLAEQYGFNVKAVVKRKRPYLLKKIKKNTNKKDLFKKNSKLKNSKPKNSKQRQAKIDLTGYKHKPEKINWTKLLFKNAKPFIPNEKINWTKLLYGPHVPNKKAKPFVPKDNEKFPIKDNINISDDLFKKHSKQRHKKFFYKYNYKKEK